MLPEKKCGARAMADEIRPETDAAFRDDGESIGLFEPLTVSEGAKARPLLNTLARTIAEKATSFATSTPPAFVDALADIMRIADCYYSNLIEGHHIHPLDIERAMQGELLGDERMLELQSEALAHVTVQKCIDNGEIESYPFSVKAVCDIHRRFYELGPRQLRLMRSANGEVVTLEPGVIRSRDVKVGRHVPVSPGAVPRFLARLERAYKPTSQTANILNAACGHHRLLWVHPFLDGNGRVARLVSYAQLQSTLGTKSSWSLARGLALRKNEYMAHLQSCDEPRRGSLDGRGTLSEAALSEFAEFFLNTCIEQADFVSSLIEPDVLRHRARTWALEEEAAGRLPQGSEIALTLLLCEGECDRSKAASLIGTNGSSPEGVIEALQMSRIAWFDLSRSTLRIAFPVRLTMRIMPELLPA